MAAAAGRIAASEAALVEAVSVNGKVTVNIRRLGLGETPSKTSVDVPLIQTAGATYPSAAQAAITAMEDLWKSRAVVNFNARGTLIADARVSSLEQWAAIQTALSGVGNLTNVQVVAMDLGYARIQLSFMGTPDQLRDAMSAQGLALSGRAGQWMIAVTGAPPQRADNGQ